MRGAAFCDTRHACGDKTCKVVREMKKVTKTVWVVECEEFCPSLPGCGLRVAVAARATGECDGTCGDPCASLRKPMVPPSAAAFGRARSWSRRRSSARCRPTSAWWPAAATLRRGCSGPGEGGPARGHRAAASDAAGGAQHGGGPLVAAVADPGYTAS